MSCSYAEGLSEYHDKGKLGLPEKFDLEEEIRDKVETLTKWIREARHIVVHTGGFEVQIQPYTVNWFTMNRM